MHAEVCLHHLILNDHCYERADAERYLVAPPLRPPGHAEALWQALADGTIDTVGSDHCQERSKTIAELAPDGQGYSYGIAATPTGSQVSGPGFRCCCRVAWPGAGRSSA
jgi:hypothetical protein